MPIIPIRLGTFVYSLFVCLFVPFLAIPASAENSIDVSVDDITPQRVIEVIQNNSAAPDSVHPGWKKLWDDARARVQMGDYSGAVESYRGLQKLKPEIEEATFEFCKLLVSLGYYQEAEGKVDFLLEIAPGKEEYLLLAADVAFHLQQLSKAVGYYGQVLENDPASPKGDEALAGLAESLRSRGLRDLSLPLQEQIVTRQEWNDSGDLRTLFFDAAGRQTQRNIGGILDELLTEEVDEPILLYAISNYERLGKVDEVAELLRRYLELQPGDLKERRHLISTLQSSGKYAEALKQQQILISLLDDPGDYILETALDAETRAMRPDIALQLLIGYQQNYPDTVDVSDRIKRLEMTLARNFLAIIKNTSPELLWNDLVEIGSSRVAVFREMMRLLEKDNDYGSSLALLLILQENGVVLANSAQKIAQLYYNTGDFHSSWKYIGHVSESNRDKEYFYLKSQVAKRLGKELELLASYKQLLVSDPGNRAIREDALLLAGGLGLTEEQKSLFQPFLQISENEPKALPTFSLVISCIRDLVEMREYAEVEKIIIWADRRYKKTSEQLTIALETSQLEVSRGNHQLAEQLLREKLNARVGGEFLLGELVAINIARDNTKLARAWLAEWEEFKFLGELRLSPEIFELYVSWLKERVEENRMNPPGLLKNMEERLVAARKIFAGFLAYDHELAKHFFIQYVHELTLLYQRSGNKKILDFLEQLITENVFKRIAPEITKIVGTTLLKAQRKGSLWSTELKITSQLLDLGFYNEAESQIDTLSTYQSITRSTKFLLNRIKLYEAKQDFVRAAELVAELDQRRPGDSNHLLWQVSLLQKAARYEDAIKLLLPFADTIKNKLLLARLYWESEKFASSLRVYRDITGSSVYAKIASDLENSKVDYFYIESGEDSWGFIRNRTDNEFAIVDKMMTPSFLVSYLGREVGEIVAENYSLFNLQRTAQQELNSREAFYNKKFHYAQKSYIELLDRESSVQTMTELASIYQEIGEYKKEARLYDEIANRKKLQNQSDNLAAVSVQKSRPVNSVETLFLKEDGRNGFKNIERLGVGTTFWFIANYQTDFSFNYEYRDYQSVDSSEKINSNIFTIGNNWSLSKRYDLSASLGAEKINGDDYTSPVCNIGMEGQFDNIFSVFMTINSEPVHDTVQVLKDHINSTTFTTGIEAETPVGLSFGGDIAYSIYTDENASRLFHLFTSYIYYWDMVQFDFSYDFELLQFKEENSAIVYDDSHGGVSNYWSPGNYSQHTLAVQFKHNFLGYQEGSERKLSYYTLGAKAGLDDNDYVKYGADCNIFLEISPHFLLKGNFTFENSDDHENVSLGASLQYRW